MLFFIYNNKKSILKKLNKSFNFSFIAVTMGIKITSYLSIIQIIHHRKVGAWMSSLKNIHVESTIEYREEEKEKKNLRLFGCCPPIGIKIIGSLVLYT